MKKYILMPVLAALSLSGSVAQAQDFDNKPVVNVSNSKENLNFTWFIFFFVLAMIVNTYVLNLSETGALIGAGINSIARKALTITLFFIGASLSRDVLKAVGIKPLVQGILLWVVISVSTLAYIYWS